MMSMRVYRRVCRGLCHLLLVSLVRAAELGVGPQQTFDRIEDALVKAQPGDVITVHPQPGAEPYTQVALNISKPRITLKAAGGRIVLSGKGGDQSGHGAAPRAIVQFSPGADGGALVGFELTGAHNNSHNGAGVRINQANGVTVYDCVIHHNDMGIMSNGDGTTQAGAKQLIENCLIHSNGDTAEPGYNHNLYLGGTSVTLVGCEVHSSLTGHNIKSRAHRTTVLACYIHDSANRECDLVDAQGDTTVPGSDAVLAGNIIVKARKCSGNRGVIHFGQDGGKEHAGTLFLIHNTIVTPFVAPVVALSSDKARAQFFNNIFWDGDARQRNQSIIAAHLVDVVQGAGNWRSAGFHALLAQTKLFLPLKDVSPPFLAPGQGDYHLKVRDAAFVDAGCALPSEAVASLGGKLRQYKSPHDSELRPGDGQPDIGAYQFVAP